MKSESIQSKDLSAYADFRYQVQFALNETVRNAALNESALHHLNGGASRALDRYISRFTRAEFGIFFSGQTLARDVAALVKDRVAKGATIGDPTCGAGDLLLACLSEIELEATLDATLLHWSSRVFGADIHYELAEAARERLSLLAAARQCDRRGSLEYVRARHNSFPNIITADYLQKPDITSQIDCVVMNPPFGEMDTPSDVTWSSGKVQKAAVFTAKVVEVAKQGQDIVAVLPDVLRSGTRYERWRSHIASLADIKNIQIFGKFDATTDVDVFILHVHKKPNQSVPLAYSWIVEPDPTESAKRVSDLFNVSIGAVVPHRHRGGPWCSYLNVANSPPYEEIGSFPKRRFSGTLHKGPFVALRRTSNPNDANRLVATLVNTEAYVAVENHLIVLQPKDGTAKSCRRLLDVLKQPDTAAWINNAIRCRHLTKRVVSRLPIGGWQ